LTKFKSCLAQRLVSHRRLFRRDEDGNYWFVAHQTTRVGPLTPNTWPRPSRGKLHVGGSGQRHQDLAVCEPPAARDPDPDAVASPPPFMAFDLLYRDGHDLCAHPLRDHRARLEDVVAGSELVFAVRRLAPDGLEAWTQVIERGYEGLVAKDEASAYEGGATRRWLKVKQKEWTVAEDGWRRRRGDRGFVPRGEGRMTRLT
jgi:ATP dependent DNA ligase domain